MTDKQRHLRRFPVLVAGDKWFYIERNYGCSFHDGKAQQHVHKIRLSTILRAITKRGYLAEWDAKRLTWKKALARGKAK